MLGTNTMCLVSTFLVGSVGPTCWKLQAVSTNVLKHERRHKLYFLLTEYEKNSDFSLQENNIDQI